MSFLSGISSSLGFSGADGAGQMKRNAKEARRSARAAEAYAPQIAGYEGDFNTYAAQLQGDVPQYAEIADKQAGYADTLSSLGGQATDLTNQLVGTDGANINTLTRGLTGDGQLPQGVNASLELAKNTASTAMLRAYAKAGMTGSTAAAKDLGQIELQTDKQKFEYATAMYDEAIKTYTAGMQGLNTAGSLYTAASNATKDQMVALLAGDQVTSMAEDATKQARDSLAEAANVNLGAAQSLTGIYSAQAQAASSSSSQGLMGLLSMAKGVGTIYNMMGGYEGIAGMFGAAGGAAGGSYLTADTVAAGAVAFA